MKKSICVFAVLISGFFAAVSGSLLTFHVGNDIYLTRDRIDTTARDNDLYFDFGFGLEDIGGSGLSFQTDWKATNAFIDGVTGASARRAVDISSGYFDWESANHVFGMRLGRQQYTSLAFDHYGFDGLSVGLEPTSKTSVNLGAGLLTPTSWGNPYTENETSIDPVTGQMSTNLETKYKHYLLSNPSTSAVAMLDGALSMIPFTNLTYALALVPAPYMRSTLGYDSISYIDPISGLLRNDSLILTTKEGDKTGNFLMALGADISPVSFLRFTGSGRFSAYHKGIDRFDARLRFLPGDIGDISVYFLGEKGRIDSTNYFSIMFFKQLYEYGLTANFFSGTDIAVQFDYHFTSFHDEGTDHFIALDASNRYLHGGGVLGLGYHGESIRAYGGFSLPFLKIFSLRGNAEFYRQFPSVYQPVPYDPEFAEALKAIGITDVGIDSVFASMDPEKVHKTPRNAVLLSAGLKMSIKAIGLSFYPRVEYISNRYYKEDVRFLLTTNLFLRKYWSTGGGQ